MLQKPYPKWPVFRRSVVAAFQRSLTYVSVEPFHLFRYLDEQAFRYNNRKDMGDFDRFEMAASQIVGKRLTWKQATGAEHDPSTALVN